MVAKQNIASECAGVGHARVPAHPQGAFFSEKRPGGGARSAPGARDESIGVAASRWVRRVIAWLIRRAVKLVRRARTRQALSVMRRLADIAPSVPLVQLCLARLASSLGDMETAMPALRAVLATASTKAHRYHCRVAGLLLGLQELAAAEACLEAARGSFPNSLRVWLLLGELYRYQGRNDEAVRCYERVLDLAETNGERLRALAGLAGSCADTGRKGEAAAFSRRMIDLSPNSAQGYCHLVNCHRGAAPPDDAIEPMVRLLSSKSLPRGQRMSLHYSLAAVYDHRGNYGEAFAHLMSGNGIHARRKGRFNTEPLKKQLEETIKVFDTEFISAMSDHGCQDDFLICVVGFPRSGTTLTEQILSSHPDAIGLGERTDFRRASLCLQLRLQSRHQYPLC